MKIAILSYGSRGDIQPLVALALGLKDAGHEVCLSGKDNYEHLSWEYDIPYTSFRFDAEKDVEKQEEIKAAMETGKNVLKAARKMGNLIKLIFEDLFNQSLDVCKGADLVLYSGMCKLYGYHIGEILNIPAYPVSFQPQGRTREFPFFGLPNIKLGSWFNLFSYRLSEAMPWKAYKEKINKLRKEHGLPPHMGEPPLRKMFFEKMPFFYGFSSILLPKPADWHENQHICGFWFLGSPETWTPPGDLVDFLESGPPPIYVGYGSMSSRNPEKETEIVMEALERTRQRGVLLTGRGLVKQENPPDTVFQVDYVPHDWLFPRMAAIAHHCGAGTTGSSLLAGKPSIPIPYFGDQPFWARRIHALGVGAPPVVRNKLTVDCLVQSIETVIGDKDLKQRASRIGERIQEENGVENAVKILNRLMSHQ